MNKEEIQRQHIEYLEQLNKKDLEELRRRRADKGTKPLNNKEEIYLISELINIDKNNLYERINDGVTILDLAVENKELGYLILSKIGNTEEEASDFIFHLINHIDKIYKRKEEVSKNLMDIICKLCQLNVPAVNILVEQFEWESNINGPDKWGPDILSKGAISYLLSRDDDETPPLIETIIEKIKFKKEFLDIMLNKFLFSVKDSNGKIVEYEIKALLEMFEKYGDLTDFVNEIGMKSELLSDKAIEFFVTKKEDGRYPFEIFGEEKERFVFLLFEGHSLFLDKERREINQDVIDKFTEVAKTFETPDLSNQLIDWMWMHARPSTEVLIDESNHFLNENLPEISIKVREFHELLESFSETIEINNDNRRIIDYYIKSFHIAYANDPQLTTVALKAIIDGLRSDEINKEILYELQAFNKRFDGNDTGSAYCPGQKCIIIDGKQVTADTFIHETGHMLHEILDLSRMPKHKDFNMLALSLRSRIESLGIVDKFSEQYKKLTAHIYEQMRERLEEDEYFKSQFKDFDFDEILSKLNIDDDKMEFIKSRIEGNAKDFYVLHQMEAAVKQMGHFYTCINYPWLDATLDIMDAIFDGELHERKDFPGHGEDYYKRDEETRFQEIFANYFEIRLLAPDQVDVIKTIFGEEFVTYMDDYINEITAPYRNVQDETKGKRI